MPITTLLVGMGCIMQMNLSGEVLPDIPDSVDNPDNPSEERTQPNN